MKKLIRIVTATLLLAACVAAASPDTGTLVLQDGPSPVPLCDPRNPKCQMPLERPSAAPAHR